MFTIFLKRGVIFFHYTVILKFEKYSTLKEEHTRIYSDKHSAGITKIKEKSCA